MPKSNWGSHSKEWRDREARKAATTWGISRRSARERYNRGTWTPYARLKTDRIPRSIARQGNLPTSEARARIYARVNRWNQDELEWETGGRKRFKERLDHIDDPKAIRFLLGMSEREFRANARWQLDENGKPRKGVPKWIVDMGYEDDNGYWHNIFWYH